MTNLWSVIERLMLTAMYRFCDVLDLQKDLTLSVQRLFYSPLVFSGGVRGFGGGRAPKARSESRRRMRRGGWGGVWNFFLDFWSPNSDFWCIVGLFLRFSGLFWMQTAVAWQWSHACATLLYSQKYMLQYMLVVFHSELHYRPVTRSLSEIVLHNLLTFLGEYKTFGGIFPL